MNTKEFLIFSIRQYTDEEIVREMMKTLTLVPIDRISELYQWQLEDLLASLSFTYGSRWAYPDEPIEIQNFRVLNSDNGFSVTFSVNNDNYVCRYNPCTCKYEFSAVAGIPSRGLFLSEENFVKTQIAMLRREVKIPA